MGGDLFLGVDGGGSKCKARLENGEGECLGEGVAGPANAFQNPVQARASVVDAARYALAAAGLPEQALDRLVVGAGLAGINIPSVRQEVVSWAHPFAHLYLEADVHIACLGAHQGRDGAVIVAGTGSVGHSIIGGVGRDYGAHGFPFGDKGSGAWLGLEALKAVLLALDGLGPQTELQARVELQLETSGLGIVDAMAGSIPRDYGALAPLVLAAAEEGDAVAVGIVSEGASYLSDMAGKLLADGSLRADGSTALCMLGGISPRIYPWLHPSVRARVTESLGQPEEGAVLLARNMFAR